MDYKPRSLYLRGQSEPVRQSQRPILGTKDIRPNDDQQSARPHLFLLVIEKLSNGGADGKADRLLVCGLDLDHHVAKFRRAEAQIVPVALVGKDDVLVFPTDEFPEGLFQLVVEGANLNLVFLQVTSFVDCTV